MKPSLEIDHSAPSRTGRHGEPVAGAAWDDGERIATTEPDIYRDEPETESRADLQMALGNFLAMLADVGDATKTGQILLVLAFLAGQTPFRTKRELATRLKLSPGRVSQLLADIPLELQTIARLKSRSR